MKTFLLWLEAKVPFAKKDIRDDTIAAMADYVRDNPTDGVMRTFLRKIERIFKSIIDDINTLSEKQIYLHLDGLVVYLDHICYNEIRYSIARKKLLSGQTLPEIYQTLNRARNEIYKRSLSPNIHSEIVTELQRHVHRLEYIIEILFNLSKETHSNFDSSYDKTLNNLQGRIQWAHGDHHDYRTGPYVEK